MKMIKNSHCCLSEMSFFQFEKNAPAQHRFYPHESCSDRHNETQINAVMLKCSLMHLCLLCINIYMKYSKM